MYGRGFPFRSAVSASVAYGAYSLLSLSIYAPSPSTCSSSCSNNNKNNNDNNHFQKVLTSLYASEKQIRSRWIKDEDNWRKLPARAWPPIQPPASSEESLRKKLNECETSSQTTDSTPDSNCATISFNLATCLVFNNLSPSSGLKIYLSTFEKYGHTDSALAAGIVLTEGFHLPSSSSSNPDLKKGSEYILESSKLSNVQGKYELGCLYYTGSAEPFIREDMMKAYEMFREAAEEGHTCSKFMLSDFLFEGVPDVCEPQKGEALQLLYEAGEKGHRFARQRLLEILDENR
ncbi:hypothetical protein TrST_g8686 [Triparma strigata]|uniref:Uncharacterized protein n=1 Tax=Triparma strigata TaxID=1606541 RepID=A0A9W7AR27_9STRA|nr:hypothetical protein TrST_g8686 [Triparma strigata]